MPEAESGSRRNELKMKKKNKKKEPMLESQVSVLQGSSLETLAAFLCCIPEEEFFLLSRSSIDWIRPTLLAEGNLFYLVGCCCGNYI